MTAENSNVKAVVLPQFVQLAYGGLEIHRDTGDIALEFRTGECGPVAHKQLNRSRRKTGWDQHGIPLNKGLSVRFPHERRKCQRIAGPYFIAIDGDSIEGSQ